MASLQAKSLENAVLFLEKVAADPQAATEAFHADNQLRKRLLLAAQKAIPELETPGEASQRILYNVSRFIIATVEPDSFPRRE